MVDLGGYVIILVETKDKKIKLYGSSDYLDTSCLNNIRPEQTGFVCVDITHSITSTKPDLNQRCIQVPSK
uniref:Uncharacterized protein n=1 Tax=Timema poppense TaxID=170557 RepID=A0A7R9DK33_TIMPO|nr:unnamed protein product [Timema poppensis]